MTGHLRNIVLYAAGALLVLFLAFALWLLAWPVPIDPVGWQPPPAPAPRGVYEPNSYLADARLIGTMIGPEDVAVGPDGLLYTGTADGNVFRIDPETERVEHWVSLGNGTRVNGIEFDDDGNLIACVANLGVVSIDTEGGTTVLVDQVEGRPLEFANDLDIGPDGIIYFSELTWRVSQSIENPIDEFLERRPRGSLFAFEPSTRSTRKVLGDLFMANGVAVTSDGASVLVAENATYRIRRVWIDGSGREPDLFADLPGVPDNLTLGESGLIWVAIAAPRSPLVDMTAPRPWATKALYRLYTTLELPLPTHSYVVALDSTGTVVLALQDPTGSSVGLVTSVLEHQGDLFLGSHIRKGLGRIPAPLRPLGLEAPLRVPGKLKRQGVAGLATSILSSSAISLSERPSSASTSSVCSPWAGLAEPGSRRWP